MKKFSVATFNLFNLNEPGLPMYKDAQGWTQEQYNRKITWTAHQIDLLNADVLAFQELWHAESLKRAFNHSSMAGKIVLGSITDTFTGDGSTTTQTINNGRNVNDVLVIVNGIILVPTTDYTISTTTLTFVTAPAASAEIQVRYL